MRWPRALLIGTALLVPLSGCRTCDQVEAALRQRETQLRETKEELDRQHCLNKALQLELEMQRSPQLIPGIPSIEGDKLISVSPVRTVTLGRQTGGVDDSGGGGDQALQVIVEPKAADGHAIKVPAALLVQVLEVSPEGVKRPLSSWDVPPDHLSRTWRSGLLTTGYALTLPWKTWPSTEKLRVAVQLRLADGRVFEADRDITIRLPPPGQRRIMPPPEPIETLPKEETLPPPRKLDGPSLGAKPKFNEVQRDPVTVPIWNDPWRSAKPAVPTVQMHRPVARDN